MDAGIKEMNGIEVVPNLPEGMADFVVQAGDKGMDIHLVRSFGSEQDLRAAYGITSEDFVVLAFMAGKEPEGMPEIGNLAEEFPYQLSLKDGQCGLNMPRANGGGGSLPSSYMARWGRGSTKLGCPAYFLSLEVLVSREEIPKKKGTALCIHQPGGASRIGYRMDGLASLGDFFLVFPGGFGTIAEVCHMLVNMSISADFTKKMVFIDPLYIDPLTKKKRRFYAPILEPLLHTFLSTGTASVEAAQRVMNNVLLYQPPLNARADTMTQDLLSLATLTRMQAGCSPAYPDLLPIKDEARRDLIQPMSVGSCLSPVLSVRGIESEWIKQIQSKLVAVQTNQKQLNFKTSRLGL